MADVSAFIESLQPWFAEHLARDQRDGKEGHILDTSQFGGRVDTPTLLLKTVGRKSGRGCGRWCGRVYGYRRRRRSRSRSGRRRSRSCG